MENLEAQDALQREDNEQGSTEARIRKNLPGIVFAVVSLGFLLYLAIGTVEARIWRFGRLYFEDRNVRDVWGYLGDHVPDMPGQGIITVLYWVSLIVMIAGVILGLWLFLGPDDGDPAIEAATTRPEHSGSDV